jgi:hypothetical protein
MHISAKQKRGKFLRQHLDSTISVELLQEFRLLAQAFFLARNACWATAALSTDLIPPLGDGAPMKRITCRRGRGAAADAALAKELQSLIDGGKVIYPPAESLCGRRIDRHVGFLVWSGKVLVDRSIAAHDPGCVKTRCLL